MKTKPISFPFSVADTTSGPVLRWESERLTVEFSDYLKSPCHLVFSEVCHFEWLVEDELDSTIFSYDSAVEVVESPIIARLTEIGEISANTRSGYRHWVIGFNEVGAYLVVIFRNLDWIGAET